MAEFIKELNGMAKKVYESIISDSLRFNGKAPVQHARRFHFKERLEEAITK